MGITIPTVKVLWARAHDQCAFPGCQQPLTDDAKDAVSGVVTTNPAGEQAHIRSYKPNGPRFDPNYHLDLHAYENLILLCPTHHAKIDANDGAEFTVSDLVQMRTKHEALATRRAVDVTIRKYVAQQYGIDDKVLFEQVELNGPSVDAMFVDVPFGCHPDAEVAGIMQRIARESPGDRNAYDDVDGQIITGAAQALLHPDWVSNALLVGGPGQGKSTLLQYVCQFFRARMLDRMEYRGHDQQLSALTEVRRVPIRLDLRQYALWASQGVQTASSLKRKNGKKRSKSRSGAEVQRWPTIEEYIASEIAVRSGGRDFSVEDLATLVSTHPVLIALDGLDEVADVQHREQVSSEIVDTQNRLEVDAVGLVVLVATRPGGTTSALWSSPKFPRLNLRRLTQGLRLQYLQRWASVANLKPEAANKLQKTFLDNQNTPHIQELASYPMQLAILLHLLHRRQLLPQERTELYGEYLKTFLDREQTGEKEPLLAEERQVIEDIHAYVGWHIHSEVEKGGTSGSIERATLTRLIYEHVHEREDGQALAKKLSTAFTTRVLCLVEREPGTNIFQFEVQSLREYFAALYIFDEANRDKRDDCLSSLLIRPYWSNVCRFFVGHYSKGEVRGMRHLLQDLQKDKTIGLHPLLRSTAAQFLNDRTYEGQKEEPMQEIVDFIFSGPGIVLSEDGLLETSGSGLRLSDRAGRAQAVRHLKARLADDVLPETRIAAATSLRRHATEADRLQDWWWDLENSTNDWLETASKLRIFAVADSDKEARLALKLGEYNSGSTWATDLVAEGDYTGSDDRVFSLLKKELNDGAVETVKPVGHGTPIADALIATHLAMSRSPHVASNFQRNQDDERPQHEQGIYLSIIRCTEAVSRISATTEFDWYQRLILIRQEWGDGWVLRQAVSAIPQVVDLHGVAEMTEADQVLTVAVAAEAEARTHRRDIEWWKSNIDGQPDGLQKIHWAFSLLTVAYSPVIAALSDQLNTVVDGLFPKHYLSLRNAIRAFHENPAVSRGIAIHELLRLNQATLSARTLWLARAGATESTVEQIDKRIMNGFVELLESVPGDLRELARVAGKAKAIKFDHFRGRRASLPIGGWSSTTKLGTLSPRLAGEILQHPGQWPGDLVQRAIENFERRLWSDFPSLSQVADDNDWFND